MSDDKRTLAELAASIESGLEQAEYVTWGEDARVWGAREDFKKYRQRTEALEAFVAKVAQNSGDFPEAEEFNLYYKWLTELGNEARALLALPSLPVLVDQVGQRHDAER